MFIGLFQKTLYPPVEDSGISAGYGKVKVEIP